MPVGAVVGAIAGPLVGGFLQNRANRRARGAQEQAFQRRLGNVGTYQDQAQGIYQQGLQRFSPYTQGGARAQGLLSGAFGAGGSGGIQNAFNAFQNTTGYQSALQDALGAISNQSAGAGQLLSGNAANALAGRATQVGNQYYGSFLSGLQNQAQQGFNAQQAISSQVVNPYQQALQNAFSSRDQIYGGQGQLRSQYHQAQGALYSDIAQTAAGGIGTAIGGGFGSGSQGFLNPFAGQLTPEAQGQQNQFALIQRLLGGGGQGGGQNPYQGLNFAGYQR